MGGPAPLTLMDGSNGSTRNCPSLPPPGTLHMPRVLTRRARSVRIERACAGAGSVWRSPMSRERRWFCALAAQLLACAGAPRPAPAPLQAAAAPQCPPTPAPTDPVVAVVGTDRIRRSALLRYAENTLPERPPAADGADPHEAENARLGVALDAMIDDTVIRRQAERLHVEATEGEVDAAIQQAASQNHLTVEDLHRELERRQIDREDYRRRVRDQILRLRLLSLRAGARDAPTDAEVEVEHRRRDATAALTPGLRAQIRGELVARRATCEDRTLLADLRRREQVQFLLERTARLELPPVLPHVVPLAAVRVSGNRAIPTPEITRRLGAIRDGNGEALVPLGDDGRIADEITNGLNALYYDRGYLTVQIANPPEVLPACRTVVDHASLTVTEGPRFRIGALDVREEGAAGQPAPPPGDAASLRAMVPAQTGQWFDRSALTRGIGAIYTRHRDAGYATVSIVPEVQLHNDTRVVDVHIAIQRGPLVTMERINVQGLRSVAEATVRGEVQLVAGQLYNETRYQETRRRLTSLGLFEQVDMSTEAVPDRPDRLIVNIALRERQP